MNAIEVEINFVGWCRLSPTQNEEISMDLVPIEAVVQLSKKGSMASIIMKVDEVDHVDRAHETDHPSKRRH